MTVNVGCEHKYVHIRSIALKKMGTVINSYSLTDYFFCEKCLRTEHIVKTEDATYYPTWWLAARKSKN